MPNLFSILASSYLHTKNHKNLWFFGFFLGAYGAFNFLRLVHIDSGALQSYMHKFSEAHQANPLLFWLIIIAVSLMLFVIFALGVIAKTCTVNAAVLASRKQPIKLHELFKHSSRYFRRVFWIIFLTYIIALVLSSWLAAPALFIFLQGFYFRAVLLALIAIGIMFFILYVLYLISTFSVCFVVAFDLKAGDAVKSAFDLFYRFLGISAAFMIIISMIYVLLFFAATVLFGLIKVIAFVAGEIFHSAGIASLSFGLFAIILAVILLFLNALVNVFSNTAWTLFFLELVKTRPQPSEQQPEPAPSL